MSQGQWSVVTSPMRRHLVSGLTIHHSETLNGAKQEAGILGDAVKGRGREGRDNIKYMKDICVLLGAVREEA